MARLETSLTRLLGIDVPVIQAPIGSAATPELAAEILREIVEEAAEAITKLNRETASS